MVSVIAAATFATWLGLGLSGRLDPALLPPGTTPLLLALLSAGVLCCAAGVALFCLAESMRVCSLLGKLFLQVLFATGLWSSYQLLLELKITECVSAAHDQP